MVVFGYGSYENEKQERFLPYSAVFLNFNVLIISTAIFLHKYKNLRGVNSIIEEHFPVVQGEVLDRHREGDILEEIER